MEFWHLTTKARLKITDCMFNIAVRRPDPLVSSVHCAVHVLNIVIATEEINRVMLRDVVYDERETPLILCSPQTWKVILQSLDILVD